MRLHALQYSGVAAIVNIKTVKPCFGRATTHTHPIGTDDLLQRHLETMLGPGATFRPGQREAIEAIARDGERALVVQRTGWGKSLVYWGNRDLLELGAAPFPAGAIVDGVASVAGILALLPARERSVTEVSPAYQQQGLFED